MRISVVRPKFFGFLLAFLFCIASYIAAPVALAQSPPINVYEIVRTTLEDGATPQNPVVHLVMKTPEGYVDPISTLLQELQYISGNISYIAQSIPKLTDYFSSLSRNADLAAPAFAQIAPAVVGAGNVIASSGPQLLEAANTIKALAPDVKTLVDNINRAAPEITRDATLAGGILAWINDNGALSVGITSGAVVALWTGSCLIQPDSTLRRIWKCLTGRCGSNRNFVPLMPVEEV